MTTGEALDPYRPDMAGAPRRAERQETGCGQGGGGPGRVAAPHTDDSIASASSASRAAWMADGG